LDLPPPELVADRPRDGEGEAVAGLVQDQDAHGGRMDSTPVGASLVARPPLPSAALGDSLEEGVNERRHAARRAAAEGAGDKYQGAPHRETVGDRGERSLGPGSTHTEHGGRCLTQWRK